MALFNLELVKGEDFDTLKIGFGDESGTNQALVAYVDGQIKSLPLGGLLIKINGPASLPVAFVIAHKVAHLYGAVAYFDPKLSGYVICLVHGNPNYKVGDLIPV